MSTTFTLTGNSANLSCSIFPEVVLDENSEYSCALLELTTYQTIQNVNLANNRVHYYATGEDQKAATGPSDGHLYQFRVPPGSYEAHEILDYIKHIFSQFDFRFEYNINKNTSKVIIKCSTAICIPPPDDCNIFRSIFGFTTEKICPLNEYVYPQNIIKIANQDVVRVECNLTTGSYVNGVSSHTIYEFATNKVEVGYKIIEQPRNLIYLPVAYRRLNYIEISLVDQNGEPIDFSGETVTCRIHVKKD